MPQKSLVSAIACLLFLSSIAVAGTDDLSDDEKQAGFVSMFNGRDFTGWRFTGDLAPEEVTNWKVADGLIQLRGGGKPHLATEREYGDFEMRFEWCALKDKYNSGFFIRSDNRNCDRRAITELSRHVGVISIKLSW